MRAPRSLAASVPFVVAAIVVACGSSGSSSGDNGSSSGATASGGVPVDGGTQLPEGQSPAIGPAQALTVKLGGTHAAHFLVGMGNDGTNGGNDDAYNLGVPLDINYHYLPGISTAGGWTTYNQNPDYAALRISQSAPHGTVTMFTYYGMASEGDGNLGVLTDDTFLATYFKDFQQLLGDIATANVPVLLQIEPDFWGYLGQETVTKSTSIDQIPVHVSAANVAECAGLPNTAAGLGQCYVKLIRARAPTCIFAFHASPFATNFDVNSNTDPTLDIAAQATQLAAMFKAMGADKADFMTTDTLDRDAGCYEAGYTDNGNVVCSKSPGKYWDESNATLPNFHQHLTWVEALTAAVGLPLMWWQTPFGSPSTTPGGTPGDWRDNRVHYFFGHIDELVKAGGVGVVFGTGAGGQSYLTSEFKTDVTAYFASPAAL